MDKVRWGLISTANINRKVIPAIRASSRGELAAVASRDRDQARSYADRWSIPKAFGTYQEMLDSGTVDAVYISLPNHLHAEWSIKALRAGVNVLVEKPFATTMQETEAMIAAAGETGKALAEAFMYRHHPQAKIAGEWVHTGRLGKPLIIRGAFTYRMKSRENVRLVPEYGGGSLWDVGIYPLSIAQYFFGSAPRFVTGAQWIGDTGVDEDFTGQMIYPNGELAQIVASFRVPYHTFVEVMGEEGRLTMTRPFNEIETNRKVMFYPNEGEPREIPVPEQNLYLGEIEDMQAVILDGASPYLSLQETRDHMRTALALYESARTGQTVVLS